MKPLRPLAFILMIGLSFAPPAFAGQKDTTSKTQSSNEEFQKLLEMAKIGDAVAQYNLALMYDEGKNTPQNYVEAVKWYKLSAGRGNANAQSNLGAMYAEGTGVPKDYAEAVKWYRLSAGRGNTVAQYNLGLMCAQGQGAPKDYVEAYKWFNLVASSSTDKGASDEAKRNVGVLTPLMTPAQIAEAQKRAWGWKAVK